MNTSILLVEDSESHLSQICKKIFSFSIDSNINKLKEDGIIILKKQKLFMQSNDIDLVICNNKKSAESYIKESATSIIFCMLDLILPENNSSKEATSKIHGYNVLELLQNNNIFTFIISADKDVLEELFDEADITIRRDETQFIYKNFLTEDKHLSEYYSRLVKDFIVSHLTNTKWKIIISIGNFKGIDHIVEIYQKIVLLDDKDYYIESLENLRIENIYNILINVPTEYSTLKNVLLHYPGLEVSLVDPSNKGELLFDQPVDYARFSNQYEYFHHILSTVTNRNGGKVFTIKDLLFDLLNHPTLGTYNKCLLLLNLIQKKYLSVDKFWDLIQLQSEVLIEIVISGQNSINNKKYLEPIPNLFFTRDNIISIHGKIFLPPMTKAARKRENVLVEYIMRNHPDFEPYLAKDFVIDEEDLFEGGDFILFDDSTLFIGISDRTSLHSVRKITEYIFKNIKKIDTIVGINASLQHERSMHLDTYMGVIGKYVLLSKDPLLSSTNNTFYIFNKKITGYDIEIILGNFHNLLDVLNKEFEVIEVTEEREAYDDACNVLTISPNIYLTYDRGQQTISLMGKKGFNKVTFDEEHNMWNLLEFENDKWNYKNAYESLDSFIKEDSKLIFEIPGSELILARGGCHCMSMPLTRE